MENTFTEVARIQNIFSSQQPTNGNIVIASNARTQSPKHQVAAPGFKNGSEFHPPPGLAAQTLAPPTPAPSVALAVIAADHTMANMLVDAPLQQFLPTPLPTYMSSTLLPNTFPQWNLDTMLRR